MSPEQALGKGLDHRTDLFSLGVVLYECATGRLPFHGETVTETITKIIRDEPAPASLSAGLQASVSRCLQKNPAARFGSARELAEALDEQLAVAPTSPYTRESSGPYPLAPETVQTVAQPAPRRRWPLIAAGSAAVIVAVLGAIVALQPKPKAAPAPPPKVAVTTSSAIEAAASTVIEVPAAPTATVASIPPPVPPSPATSSAASSQSAARSAADFYNDGMARLVERQPFRAREAFQSAIERDPNHAKAHFRLGEMALFGRDFAEARRELDLALAHADGLELRERKLAELGLALLDRNHARAAELLDEITTMSPRDPDLLQFRELMERPADRPFRGRRPRPRP
jgi:serine/threonine protein kinase